MLLGACMVHDAVQANRNSSCLQHHMKLGHVYCAVLYGTGFAHSSSVSDGWFYDGLNIRGVDEVCTTPVSLDFDLGRRRL
jgi:hypothetical protein